METTSLRLANGASVTRHPSGLNGAFEKDEHNQGVDTFVEYLCDQFPQPRSARIGRVHAVVRRRGSGSLSLPIYSTSLASPINLAIPSLASSYCFFSSSVMLISFSIKEPNYNVSRSPIRRTKPPALWGSAASDELMIQQRYAV